MKKLIAAFLLFGLTAMADTPPPVNIYAMKAPGGEAVPVAHGGAVIPIGPGCTTGYLLTYGGSSTGWTCQAAPAGGVTSVGLALPSSVFSVSGSPVTSSGTLTGTFQTQAANSFFSGPVNGSPGTPAFRSMVAADLVGVLSGTAPITYSGGAIACITATGSVNGCLSSTDWTTFNGKQAAGNYITATTGDVVATGPGSVAATIQSGVVSNAKLATMAAHSFKGNNTGSTAAPLDLTATQLTAELNAFVGDSGSGGTKGSVPAPASGDAAAGKYLKADGTWATVPAGGVTTMGAFGSSPNGNGATISGSTLTLQPADGSNPGGVSTGTQTIAGAKTLSGATTLSAAGALSAPALLVSGAPVTGGSATTTKPLVNIETAGVVSNNWSTSGTTLGINGPTGFAGKLIDAQVNGADVAWITSGGLFVSQSGTERIECGMTGSTRYSCNQAAHAGELFYQYAANSGAQQWGYGTFNNNYTFSFNNGGTATYSAANVVGGFTTPQINIRNSNNTANNFGDINFSGVSDNVVAWIAGTTVTQTTNSEDGRLTFGTTSAGTRADKLKIEMKGQMTHGGTAPTLTCGTGATVAGNDNTGRVTVGTSPGTTCTITFAATWANAPHCDATDETAAAGAGVVVPCVATTTAAVCTYASLTASDKLSFSCRGFF